MFIKLQTNAIQTMIMMKLILFFLPKYIELSKLFGQMLAIKVGKINRRMYRTRKRQPYVVSSIARNVFAFCFLFRLFMFLSHNKRFPMACIMPHRLQTIYTSTDRCQSRLTCISYTSFALSIEYCLFFLNNVFEIE